MDFLSIFFLAVGLAMDSFAVCIGKGMCCKRFLPYRSFKIALVFGFFQGVMPLIGYLLGVGFSVWIQEIDHWLAFVILAFLGVKMIVEGRPSNEVAPTEDSCKDVVCDEQKAIAIPWKKVLTLALATSIDAMATGLLFVTARQVLFVAVWTIGVVCLFFSFLGIWIGVRCGKSFRFNIEAFGGIILIAIGTKILIEHLWIV